VNFPLRGIGARALEALQDQARGSGTSLWQAACAGALAGKAGSAIAGFVRLIESMRAATAGLPLSETVDHINHASGLIAHYKTEKDGQDRIENLNELVNAAESFLREADFAVDAPVRIESPRSASAEGEAPTAEDAAAQEGATDPLTAF